MRFVFYIDAHFTYDALMKFQKEQTKRFEDAGILRAGDALIVVPRPGYITEIVALGE